MRTKEPGATIAALILASILATAAPATAAAAAFYAAIGFDEVTERDATHGMWPARR